MSADLPKMPEPIRAFAEHAKAEGHDTAYTYDTERSRWVFLNPMTADLWRYWQEASRLAMEREAVLREALQTIADWRLPATGKFWDEAKTRPVSYEAEVGSNGARGYMRSVAQIALDNTTIRALADVDAKEKAP